VAADDGGGQGVLDIQPRVFFESMKQLAAGSWSRLLEASVLIAREDSPDPQRVRTLFLFLYLLAVRRC
jgi:hypothetical protein